MGGGWGWGGGTSVILPPGTMDKGNMSITEFESGANYISTRELFQDSGNSDGIFQMSSAFSSLFRPISLFPSPAPPPAPPILLLLLLLLLLFPLFPVVKLFCLSGPSFIHSLVLVQLVR